MTTMSDALASAVGAEQEAARVLSDLERTARAGGDVDPVEFARASGEVSVRRLRREALEAESAAESVAHEDARRRERLAVLSADAANDPALNPEHLAELERTARAAVQDYAQALESSEKAFSRLVARSREAGLPLIDRTEAAVNEGLVASHVMRRGDDVIYGPPGSVRLAGTEYRPPRRGLLHDLADWVRDLAEQ